MAIHDDKTGMTLLDAQVPFVTGVLPPKLEKHYMNPDRYRMNYQIMPCYALFCVICLALGLLLMEIDDSKFAPLFIGLLVLVGIASAWLLTTVPKMRKKELVTELERYDFDDASVPKQTQYTILYEGAEVCFSASGLTVGDQFFWYGRLNPALVTSNRFNRVWVAVQFGNDPAKSLFVPLSPMLIRAVEELEIPLQNQDEYQYLLKNKENAFAQIYKYGTFQIFDYD